MSAFFQDFGYLTERRRPERQQRRRRMHAATATVFAILVLAVVEAATAVDDMPAEAKPEHESVSIRRNADTDASDDSDDDALKSSVDDVPSNSAVSLICASTDFKATCLSALNRVVNATASTKDLVRAAVTVVVDEVGRAFKRSDRMESDDPPVKGAVKVCQEVRGYTVSDLMKTLSAIDANHLSELPKVMHDLRTWLSAAVAYQQTCIDSYPDGEMKTKMQKAMKGAKELTSNALAIIGSLSSLLSFFTLGGKRRLHAAVEPPQPDYLPSWVYKGDRRVLLGKTATRITANVTVAQDGSGDFTTINDALAMIPIKYDGRYVVYVKEGVYDEQVQIERKMINVTFYGDGATKSVITGHKNYVDGVKTFFTASMAVIGDGFMAVDMGFRNTAGPAKEQAVALRVNADRAIFLNCRMEGYQDTLYAHSHRQFYHGCFISGTVDFIFGDSSTVFQNCILTARKPLENQKNIFLAQGRSERRESTGFVIQNCKFVAEPDLIPVVSEFKTFLGRPWKEFSNTIIMESEIGDFVQPEGYMPMNGDAGLDTLTYSEYGNTGGGADTSKRVTWPGVKVISAGEAMEYTVVPFIQGDEWIPMTRTPVKYGLFSE